MSHITASFPRFADAEEAYSVTLQAFESTLAELEHRLHAGLAAWDGDAKRAYQVFHDTWHFCAEDMVEALRGLHRAIGICHENFRSAKTASLRTWTPR